MYIMYIILFSNYCIMKLLVTTEKLKGKVCGSESEKSGLVNRYFIVEGAK